jgi:hypothetical protein
LSSARNGRSPGGESRIRRRCGKAIEAQPSFGQIKPSVATWLARPASNQGEGWRISRRAQGAGVRRRRKRNPRVHKGETEFCSGGTQVPQRTHSQVSAGSCAYMFEGLRDAAAMIGLGRSETRSGTNIRARRGRSTVIGRRPQAEQEKPAAMNARYPADKERDARPRRRPPLLRSAP